MKKWVNFFCFGFFSHRLSRESVKRSYVNAFLGFLLALAFIFAGFVGGDMLSFAVHYSASSDFSAQASALFANPDADKRIEAEIENGTLKLKKRGGEFAEALLVNTLESEADRQSYSVNGYNAVIDTRPAETLAEIEAYCVSNDGKNTEISYAEYLTLSEVARLNFDFRIRYTGNALELTDGAVLGYRTYLEGLNRETKESSESLAAKLGAGEITANEYNRAIYELYFVNYYPEITAYESTSRVPLLRNYYYHEYLVKGTDNYLFVFDDYLTGSFETENGLTVSFYGFYSGLENGAVALEGEGAVNGFIKDTVRAARPLNTYAYFTNTVTLAPFIALMLMVAALLAYSVLKLKGVEDISSLGSMIKIVGSYTWFSGLVSAALTLPVALFVNRSLIGVLPPVLFFLTLLIRSVIFTVEENRLYVIKRSEQRNAERTEE